MFFQGKDMAGQSKDMAGESKKGGRSSSTFLDVQDV